MENFSLDGFQLLHPNAKSILQEHRVILGLFSVK